MNWDRAWIYERDCQFWHTGWQRRGEKKSKTMKNAGDAVHIWSSKVQKWNISNAGWSKIDQNTERCRYARWWKKHEGGKKSKALKYTCDDVPVWSFKVQKWNITNTFYMLGGEKQTWHWTRQGFNWGMILKSWKLENKSSYPPHFQCRSVQKSEGGPVAECGPPIYNPPPPLPKKMCGVVKLCVCKKTASEASRKILGFQCKNMHFLDHFGCFWPNSWLRV